MKRIFLFLIGFVIIAKCYSQQQNPVATNAWIFQIFTTNSQGEVLIQPAPPEVLKVYEQHPNQFGTNELKSIAIGYLFQTNQQRAIGVLQQLLAIDPNDKKTIRWLGRCYVLDKQPEKAIGVLKQSSRMGDDESVLTLAEIYCFVTTNYHELGPLIPKIIDMRKRTADVDEKHDTTVVLLTYLLHAGHVAGGEKILSQSLDGLNDDSIVANNDVAELAIHVLEMYQQTNRANRLVRKLSNFDQKLNPPRQP